MLTFGGMLRVLVGLVFLASAILKLLSLDSPAFHSSAVWSVLHESRVAVIGLCVLEGTGGLLLIADFARRWVSLGLAFLITAGGMVIAVREAAREASFPSCGCLGSPKGEELFGSTPWELRLIVLAISLLYLAFCRSSPSRGVPPAA